MSVFNDLKNALEKQSYVRVSLENEGFEGFVIGLSKTFVLMQSLHDWHDNGASILSLGAIESCDVSDYQDDQLKIIAFNSVKRTKRYNWINLSDYQSLFNSLKPKAKFCIITIEDEADVGRIETVSGDSVVLKAVDPGGNWIDEPVDCPYEDIIAIQFDDAYSRVLQRYAERASTLN